MISATAFCRAKWVVSLPGHISITSHIHFATIATAACIPSVLVDAAAILAVQVSGLGAGIVNRGRVWEGTDRSCRDQSQNKLEKIH